MSLDLYVPKRSSQISPRLCLMYISSKMADDPKYCVFSLDASPMRMPHVPPFNVGFGRKCSAVFNSSANAFALCLPCMIPKQAWERYQHSSVTVKIAGVHELQLRQLCLSKAWHYLLHFKHIVQRNYQGYWHMLYLSNVMTRCCCRLFRPGIKTAIGQNSCIHIHIC